MAFFVLPNKEFTFTYSGSEGGKHVTNYYASPGNIIRSTTIICPAYTGALSSTLTNVRVQATNCRPFTSYGALRDNLYTQAYDQYNTPDTATAWNVANTSFTATYVDISTSSVCTYGDGWIIVSGAWRFLRLYSLVGNNTINSWTAGLSAGYIYQDGWMLNG